MRLTRQIILGLLLFLGTLAVYWHVCSFSFVNYDDEVYVVNNPHVLGGLTWDAIRWDFGSEDFRASNWHPLTWLSLQLDAQLHGFNPYYFHETNIFFHAASAVLVFWLLSSMTSLGWRSALVAALFALHPLRVESVAWVSERKDVLSVFFGLAALIAYVAYARSRDRHGRSWSTRARYGLTVLIFALGLMAKPMLVTLPCVMQLLDYWPLGRYTHSENGHALARQFGRLCLEKLPLFGLTIASCVINIVAQMSAMKMLADLPLYQRLGNAIWSYALYLGQTFWPMHLTVFYPHPEANLNWLAVAAAGLLLVGVTAFAVWQRRSHPYLLVGWLWFVGMLVPVSGIMQVGIQGMADRYTYLPHLGLLLAIVWGIAEWAPRWHLSRAAGLAAGAACLLCAVLTWIQSTYWRDSVALWEHCEEVAGETAVAENQLGRAWEVLRRRPDLALPHYREVARLKPDDPVPHFIVCLVLTKLGVYSEAADECRRAMRLKPNDPDFAAQLSIIESKWGYALSMSGRQAEAEKHFRAAAKASKRVSPLFDLALACSTRGQWVEAEKHLREAESLGMTGTNLYFQLGRALAGQGKWSKAADFFRRAMNGPESPPYLHGYLAHALLHQGQTAEAEQQYSLAQQRMPDWLEHNRRTAWALATHPDAHARQGYVAVEFAEQIVEATHERDPDCLDTLAAAYAEIGRFAEAAATARKATKVCSSAELRSAIGQRLALYESREPYRDLSLAADSRPAFSVGR